MSERVLAKMAYRAEPEGVLAVVEAPERELPRDGSLYLVAVGDREARATSARWRARPTPPAPTLSSSPRRRPIPGTRTRSAHRPARSSRCRSSRRRSTRCARSGVAARRGGRPRADDVHRRRPHARRARSRRRRGRRASDERWLDAADLRSRSRSRPHGDRQPQHGDRGCDPPLRSGAPAWLPRRRPPRTRDDRRPPAAHADALASRTLGARLKCELFQRTGSFKARGALNKLSALTAEERAPRRDHDLGRQPRAGRRLGRRREAASTRWS